MVKIHPADSSRLQYLILTITRKDTLIVDATGIASKTLRTIRNVHQIDNNGEFRDIHATHNLDVLYIIEQEDYPALAHDLTTPVMILLIREDDEEINTHQTFKIDSIRDPTSNLIYDHLIWLPVMNDAPGRRPYLHRFLYALGQRKALIRRIKSQAKKRELTIAEMELLARSLSNPGNWEEASDMHYRVWTSAPDYRDAAWQAIRTSIYTKRWTQLRILLTLNPVFIQSQDMLDRLRKKMNQLPIQERIQAIEELFSKEVNIKEFMEEWISSPPTCIKDWTSPIASIASEDTPGEHIGTIHHYLIECGLSNSADELQQKHLENFTNLDFIVSYASRIETHDHTTQLISEIVNEADDQSLKDIIRVIRRVEKLETLVDPNLMKRFVSSTDTLETWMIEWALNNNDKDGLRDLLSKRLKGTVSSLVESLNIARVEKNEDYMITLLEAISSAPEAIFDQRLRSTMCKDMVTYSDPSTALRFCLESIAINPQDAEAGRWAMEAAVGTGQSMTILGTADIVLSMRNRSQHIPYHTIAIAAAREGKIQYAKDLLKINRLNSNIEAQRLRIGIRYHLDKNMEDTLEEVSNTQEKFRQDHTILIYDGLANAELGNQKLALSAADAIRDPSEKEALRHLVLQRIGKTKMAKTSLKELILDGGEVKEIDQWIKDGCTFSSLAPVMKPRKKAPKRDNSPLVSVIMTTHRWNDAFEIAVNSILNQSHANLELIIVDDASKPADVKKYDRFLKDKRIIRVREEENRGTYSCRNRGLEVVKGKFVTFADSDDWNHPYRIARTITRMEQRGFDLSMGRFLRISETGKIQFNGQRLTQFALMGMMFRTSKLQKFNLRFDERARYSADSELFERASNLFGTSRVDRHEKIDILALFHSSSLTSSGKRAIDWMGPRESRIRYVQGYRPKHRMIVKNNPIDVEHFSPPCDDLSDLKLTHSMKRLRKAFGTSLHKKSEEILSIEETDDVHMFMATYPGGFENLHRTIKCLMKQSVPFTTLTIHINHDEAPKNIPLDPRIKVELAVEDLADNGKFAYMSDKKGYFLTVDDDLKYPRDYIERMVEHVNQLNRKAVIGLHGATLPAGPPISRWSEYLQLRRTHMFNRQQSTYTLQSILGTGTVAFHSSIGHPEIEDMDTLRMVDIHFANWANSNKVAMYSCPRDENWLTEFESTNERIWDQVTQMTQMQWEMTRALNRTSKWDSTDSITGVKLKRGPLKSIADWHHRQLAPGMVLPSLNKWKQLPENPKVTIYIPAYNVENYIIDSVNSALNQTYDNFEVSIQEGGSTDGTLQLLKQHFGDHPQVILTNAPSSIGEATNIAIKQGSGELILQLDSDDILHPDAVKKLVEAIGNEHVCAYGNFERIDETGELIDNGWEELEFTRERLLRAMIVHHPRMFRRDAWEFVGGHDESLENAEDYDLFLRLSEVGPITHLREILYSYRQLPGSASSDSSLLDRNTIDVVERAIERIGFANQVFVATPNINNSRQISLFPMMMKD